MISGRGRDASMRSSRGKSSKRSERRPNGNVSNTTASGRASAYASSSRSRRRARNASSIGLNSPSRSGVKLASDTRTGGSCTTRTPLGIRPPIGMPPLTRCVSNPREAIASAMSRARIR